MAHVWKTTYYAGNPPEEPMTKTTTAYYYGDGESTVAKEIVAADRRRGGHAFCRDASAFSGDIERCNRVVIMGGVAGAARTLIEDTYLGKVPPARGSDKWDGGVIVGGDETKEAAEAAGRYHEFKQEVPVVTARSADQQRGPQVVSRPAPEAQVVSGPKADPEEVSRGMAETNLRSSLEDPRVPDAPAKPPQPPRQRAKQRAKVGVG